MSGMDTTATTTISSMVSLTHRSFRLLIERNDTGSGPDLAPLVSPPGASAPRVEIPYLEIPSGVSHLWLDPDGEPRVFSRFPQSGLPLGRIEPLENGGAPALVLTTRDGSPLRLNGSPAPRVAPVQMRDQLQLPSGTTLHFTVYQQPRFGPPSDEMIDLECPLCRLKFDRKTRVFFCPTCAGAIHAETEETVKGRDRDPLECFRLIVLCPHCEAKVNRTEGYLYTPELEVTDGGARG